MINIGLYAKAVSAAVVAFLTALIVGLDSGGALTTSEWLTSAGALVLALLAVWAVPNTPGVPYAKAIIAGLAALLGSLATGFAVGGLSSTELLLACVAMFGALGVTYAVPNARQSDLALAA